MVTAINVGAPDLMFKLAKLEFWPLPATAVYASLARSFVLRATVTASYITSFMICGSVHGMSRLTRACSASAV